MDEPASARSLPTLSVEGPWDWDWATGGAGKLALGRGIAEAIAAQRWFGAKAREIESAEVVDSFAVSQTVRLLLATIRYKQGAPEVYQVPLGFAAGQAAERLLAESAAGWIQVVSAGRPLGVLYDALQQPGPCGQLLELFDSLRALPGVAGQLIVAATSAFEPLRGPRSNPLAPRLVHAEQSNTSVVYGDRLILKLFRRVERGLNPDFEISEHLTRQRFANAPPLAGALEYRAEGQEPCGLAMLQAYVPNRGDAWSFTLDWLAQWFDSSDSAGAIPQLPAAGICRAAQATVPREAREAFGQFLTHMELLGQRTAEVHLALASASADPAFAPEPFAPQDRRSYFRRCTDEALATFAMLAQHASRLSGRAAAEAQRLAALDAAALKRFARLADEPIEVCKIRCHGDYHLGQVLRTDGDFVIIDFEGEPVRSIDERRSKQLAMRDVAGMIRSLHYASRSAAAAARTDPRRERDQLGSRAQAWYAWSSVAFLAAYRRTAGNSVFLPKSIEAFERLLDGCLLEKAFYELRYELNNRPDWVYLPLEALVELLTPFDAPAGRQ